MHRLRDRPIIPELSDIMNIQKQLFWKRLESASRRSSPPWTMVELEKVLSSLKEGKSRDPSGLVCTILKKPVIGTDLKLSLLLMLNRIKETLQVPPFICNSNISSVWKKKGDKMKLQYHRGLFLGSIFKTIIMKLLYRRNYKTIDSNMSESNVGGRKGRSCRDHIFIVNGAIQDALSSKSSKPLDLFICDYRTMFDGLDVKITLNDLYDNGIIDDNWALIYRLYETQNVSIKTPFGLTKRRRVERELITQGDCLGPILASSTVDSFGKECYQKQKHLYMYRDKTPVSLLTMLDDVFSLSNCGPESTQINEFINIKTASKKLQFAQEKTYKLHIGRSKQSYQCKDAFIDSWEEDMNTHIEKFQGKVKVKEVWSSKYLGEIISSDGKNTENISTRKKRGFGTVKDISNMLDKMCLGPYFFRKAVVLRDSMLVGTLLSCSEAWYNISEAEIGQLEQVDKSLWCNLLEVARTVPYDLLCLEVGVEPLRFIIMRRRLVYLQHILKQEESSLVKQFLRTQSINPKKKDWVTTVKEDLEQLKINLSFLEIENMGKSL